MYKREAAEAKFSRPQLLHIFNYLSQNYQYVGSSEVEQWLVDQMIASSNPTGDEKTFFIYFFEKKKMLRLLQK